MSTEEPEIPAVAGENGNDGANGENGDDGTASQAAEPTLVRPYADIPARTVEAPAVLTGTVLEALGSPSAGADGPDAGDVPRSRFSPLRRGLSRAAERCRRTALAVPVGGLVALFLITGIVLHQAGAWPFARDTGAVAPVPDARLPLTPPVGGADSSPADRDGDDKKKPKPSKSPEAKKKENKPARQPPPSPAPSPSGTPPGEAGGGAQPGGTGCAASWQVDSQWEDFSATVRITNSSGQRINGWEVSWTWNGDQRLSKHWNAEIQESGRSVTARNVDTNAEIPTTGEASFGFEATGSGTPPPQLTCRVL